VRARLSAEAVDEGALINALRVEPELGSPTRGGLPATVIRRTPAGWTLSGHKVFATGAPGLRWMDVWARSEDDPPQVGHEFEDGDHKLVVNKIGVSPLPGDTRACVFSVGA